ncbi:MAG: cyclic pyranopterin monophosphate synthase MoaC [Bdellovibrionota bacterium]
MWLTHLDEHGAARMVDVGPKMETERIAVASCRVRMKEPTLRLLTSGRIPKGDALSVARLAGIQAAKQTSFLIPLAHPIPLTSVAVDVEPVKSPPSVSIEARAKTVGRTGVEMEALVAASTAALALYDMCKAVDRGMVIENLRLDYKAGGKSGVFERRKKKDRRS